MAGTRRGRRERRPSPMERKDSLELLPYAVHIDGLFIMPHDMRYDEKRCKIGFGVCNKRQFFRPVIRFGPHKDYIFHTKIWKTPFTVNLRSNVIKKERVLSQAPYNRSSFATERIELRDREILRVSREMAEKYLSPECLACADEVTDTDYWWTMEENGWAVVFELPNYFTEPKTREGRRLLGSKLATLAKEYMRSAGINAKNFEQRLDENMAPEKYPPGDVSEESRISCHDDGGLKLLQNK